MTENNDIIPEDTLDLDINNIIAKYGSIEAAVAHGEDIFTTLARWLSDKKPLPRERYMEDSTLLLSYIGGKFGSEEILPAVLCASVYLQQIAIHMWNHGYYCALRDEDLLEDKDGG